ncbi:hypothetical protein, partial [Anaerotignum sp.]|uniref:hypothetical protein n=1 Tax=Anaerotignum sp. TaxID=2039241 RepID=UPI00399F04ED
MRKKYFLFRKKAKIAEILETKRISAIVFLWGFYKVFCGKQLGKGSFLCVASLLEMWYSVRQDRRCAMHHYFI